MLEWRWIVIVLAFAGAATGQESLTEQKFQALVESLGHENQDVRDSASESLVKAGKPALPMIDAAMKTGSGPETLWRLENARGEIQQAIARSAAPDALDAEGENWKYQLESVIRNADPDVVLVLGEDSLFEATYEHTEESSPNLVVRRSSKRIILIDRLGNSRILPPEGEGKKVLKNLLLSRGLEAHTDERALQIARTWKNFSCYPHVAFEYEIESRGEGRVVVGTATYYYSKSAPWKERVRVVFDREGKLISLDRIELFPGDE